MDTEDALARIHAAAARVDQSLDAVTAAQQALQREALRALLAADGDEDRQRALVRALYWEVPALPVKTLEAAVGTAAQVREVAAPGPLVGPCQDCGQQQPATSRTQRAKRPWRCGACEEERRRVERERMRALWSHEEQDPPPALPGWGEHFEAQFGHLPDGWEGGATEDR